MINTIVGAGAVGAGAASRYGSGSDKKMRLLAAPAPQYFYKTYVSTMQNTVQTVFQYFCFDQILLFFFR
jgi:hypothetical protein